MKLPNEGTDELPTDGFDWIAMNVSSWKMSENGLKFDIYYFLALFNFFFFVHPFLGMMLINHQDINVIGFLNKCYLQKPVRSVLAHFHRIIQII